MSERLDRIELTYNLIFESAFHCGSGLPRLLIDRAVRRDAEGYLFVPGSTVKGALRDRCEQLARLFGLVARSPHDEEAALDEYVAPDLLSRLFGSRLHPGGMCFDDLTMPFEERDFLRHAPSLQTAERTQVSLSRRTRTAKTGLLFSSEFGLPELRFAGTISGHIADAALDNNPDSPTYGLLLLLAGLLTLDRIGGNKSTGAGCCRTAVTEFIVNGQEHKQAVWQAWLARLNDLEYADLELGVSA